MNEREYGEVLVTPEMAREYLTYNTHNRALKPVRISAYAEQMRSGSWRCNGESIKFAASGQLIDGQNRLHAIIKADVPVWLLVARGMRESDQETMDTGAPRSLADMLKLRGEVNVNVLGATIRSCYLWDQTADPVKRKLGASGQRGGTGTQATTIPTLLTFYTENAEEMRDLATRTNHCRLSTRVPVSVVAPVLREMLRIDPEDAQDFWHRLGVGLPSRHNFEERDPLVQLKNHIRRLIDDRGGYSSTEMGAVIIKAWNFYRMGEPVTQLRWRSGGSAPEPFPIIK